MPPARLDAAARAQAGVDSGTTTTPRRIYEELAPDLWAMSVVTPGRLQVAVLRVTGGRISVAAGLDQAGRELAELDVLSIADWKGALIHVVNAVGGSTPGWPDVLAAREQKIRRGRRITIRTPVSWVEYAAAGGAGPPPSASSTPDRGAAPPEQVGTLTLDISPHYDLRWSFRAGGRVLGTCEARRARTAATLSDEQLLAVVDAARRRARAPRAMPVTEPRAMRGYPGLVTVRLCMIGDVHVDLASRDVDDDPAHALARLAALGVDLGAPPPPAVLLPVLEAVGGLPSGLLASDMTSPRFESGELIAEVSGALAVWSRSGARTRTPRAPRFVGDEDPPTSARARLRLDRSALTWTLDVIP